MVVDLMNLIPVLILVLAVIVQLFFGLIKSPRLVFKYKNVNIITSNSVSIIALLSSAIAVFLLPTVYSGFSNSLLSKPYTPYLIGLVLLAGLVSVFLNGHLLKDNRQNCYKFHILLLTALIGSILAILANDFLTLFVALETMSFCIYFLVAFSRGYKSKEAAFKYLIVTAVSVAFFLFGVSYILGLTSSLNFSEITTVLESDRLNGIVYSIAVLFVFIGIAMKLSVFPFANWIIDVFKGLDSLMLNLVSTLPKITILGVLLNLFDGVFSFSFELYVMILLLAVLTAFWANIYAIKENDFKGIMGCSSAANASYLLIFLIVAPKENYAALMFYLICYVITLGGVFAYFNFVEPIIKNAGVTTLPSTQSPVLRAGYLLSILSLAGLPITSGFVAKVYLLYSMIASGVVFLPIVFLLLGLFAIALVYYIKLARVVINQGMQVVYSKNTLVIFSLVTIITFLLGILPFDLILRCVSLF